jgi:tetratricopeptide (TPR) repeat protein
MEENNPVLKLIQKGKKLEKTGNIARTNKIFEKAWNISSDNHEMCISAHFLARNQSNFNNGLKWNILALNKAKKVKTPIIKSYFPSLYLCIGISYENLSKHKIAKKYYDLAFSKIKYLSKEKEQEKYNKGIVKEITKRINNIQSMI